jgi:hypothetical protein
MNKKKEIEKVAQFYIDKMETDRCKECNDYPCKCFEDTITKSFIGDKGWINPYPDKLELPKVKILRPCLFFAQDQEITINKLGEYFTLHAISKLIDDGFVKYL